MAKQEGIVPLRGRVGNIIFFKTKNGYGARDNRTVDPETVLKDPRFLRTRQNMAEFTRATRANKTLRAAFRQLLQRITDSRMNGRLTRQMFQVIKADTSNTRGQRNIMEGDLRKLRGFDFNSSSSLDSTLKIEVACTVDRAAGKLKVDLPSFIPALFIKAPFEASHFKIVSAGAEVNFEQDTYVSETVKTDMIALDETPTQGISLVTNVPANSSFTLILLLGIEFYQETPNGDMNLLKAGAFTALRVMEASKA